MPRKLLAASALYLAPPAFAEPPVDGTRVTGNISTEHTRPVVDSCRVTGNLRPRASKAAKPPMDCQVATALGWTVLRTGFLSKDDGTCEALGVAGRVAPTPEQRVAFALSDDVQTVSTCAIGDVVVFLSKESS